jgi:hypothetical protein
VSYRGTGRDDTIRTCNLLDPNQARSTSCATSRLARMEGLEPPHADLETAALPVELHPYRTGDELRTRYFQCGRLTCTQLHLTGLWS